MESEHLQPAVQELLMIAPQFNEDLSEDQINDIESAINRLQHPISAQDAITLLSLLPANGDSYYGLNWSILHAIESSPSWPIWPCLTVSGHIWIDQLRLALSNAGFVEPSQSYPTISSGLKK